MTAAVPEDVPAALRGTAPTASTSAPASPCGRTPVTDAPDDPRRRRTRRTRPRPGRTRRAPTWPAPRWAGPARPRRRRGCVPAGRPWGDEAGRGPARGGAAPYRRVGPVGAWPDARDPQSLDSTLGRLVGERGWEQPVAVGGAFGRWDAVVGPELAGHCAPETLKDGTLVVRARVDGLGHPGPAADEPPRAPPGRGARARRRHQGRRRGPQGPSWRKGGRSAPGGAGPRTPTADGPGGFAPERLRTVGPPGARSPTREGVARLRAAQGRAQRREAARTG